MGRGTSGWSFPSYVEWNIMDFLLYQISWIYSFCFCDLEEQKSCIKKIRWITIKGRRWLSKRLKIIANALWNSQKYPSNQTVVL